jgi:hypothetical protein
MTKLVVLDNEAVQALLDVSHRKHRRVIAMVDVVATRSARAAVTISVPTAVRVEAGWDRTAPTAALANRLRIRDMPLDGSSADGAARIRNALGARISVADAHVGVAVQSQDREADVTVLTSDPADVRAVTGDRRITVVTL